MKLRTTLLLTGVGICVIVAGCSAPFGEGQRNDLSCSFNHEIVSDRVQVDDTEQHYAYSNLSSDARTVFDSSLAANGTTYSVENSSDTSPDEFEYTDTLTHYEIEQDTQTHVIATWSSEGCSD